MTPEQREALLDAFVRTGLGPVAQRLFAYAVAAYPTAIRLAGPDIGARLKVSPKAVTDAIHALESRGLVARQGRSIAAVPDPARWYQGPPESSDDRSVSSDHRKIESSDDRKIRDARSSDRRSGSSDHRKISAPLNSLGPVGSISHTGQDAPLASATIEPEAGPPDPADLEATRAVLAKHFPEALREFGANVGAFPLQGPLRRAIVAAWDYARRRGNGPVRHFWPWIDPRNGEDRPGLVQGFYDSACQEVAVGPGEAPKPSHYFTATRRFDYSRAPSARPPIQAAPRRGAGGEA